MNSRKKKSEGRPVSDPGKQKEWIASLKRAKAEYDKQGVETRWGALHVEEKGPRPGKRTYRHWKPRRPAGGLKKGEIAESRRGGRAAHHPAKARARSPPEERIKSKSEEFCKVALHTEHVGTHSQAQPLATDSRNSLISITGGSGTPFPFKGRPRDRSRRVNAVLTS